MSAIREVRFYTARVPLATKTCDHGRKIGYNLCVGYLRHLDDESDCDAPGYAVGGQVTG